MRHTTALTALTALIGAALLLTACSNTDDTAPPPTPTPSPAATTTIAPAPAPTPPAMPQTAKAHTEAGAKAFVEYFWDVVNYAQATGDTNQLADLSADGCTGCDAGIASIDDVYSKGGRIVGGDVSISRLGATFGWVRHTAVADVRFTAVVKPQVVTDSAGSHHGDGRRSRDRFTLVAEDDADWRVTDFRAER